MSRSGITMVELIAVVAIIAILAGVAFIAVVNYQRSLGQLERDGIAKEIFVAAQNHLTAAQGQGYLGMNVYGTLEEQENYAVPLTDGDGSDSDDGTNSAAVSDTGNKVYYYVVNNGTVSGGGQSAFSLMFPFGSIDETIRTGGSYLIRYQPDTATVLDVFYCSTSGSPTKFNYSLSTSEYDTYMGLRSNKSGRRNFKNGHILGYYGGTDADDLPSLQLDKPILEVFNEDRLYVKITDPNIGKTGAALRLIVTGSLSGVSHYIDVTNAALLPDSTNVYEIVLDDITVNDPVNDRHFSQIIYSDMAVGSTSNGFIPGEDITIKALAYSSSVLANEAFSAEKTTNSLFADGTTTSQAQITSIRHLENLDKKVSNLDKNDTSSLNISSAVQTCDLNWTSFHGGSTALTVYGADKTALTAAGNYYPIEPDYPLTYDGGNYSITGIKASDDNAGLFGAVSNVSSISNLELIDFSITGTCTAGALAGSLTGCAVTNVLARNSGESDSTGVTSSGSAGGLIGSTGADTTVQYSAAALTVSGTTTAGGTSNAGGLIGEISGTNVKVTGCYSGGQTNKGKYSDSAYNVTGGVAGGLVGNAGSATISSSYSTCSVDGTTVGGFVGSADNGGSITNCYCTGLVSGSNTFIGNGSPTSTGNQYYRIINEVITYDSSGNITNISYKEPGLTGISPIDNIDNNGDSFNTFSGHSSAAEPYDSTLVSNYGGKYNLKTAADLGASVPAGYFVSTHYGDWPSPEIFFVNTKSTTTTTNP